MKLDELMNSFTAHPVLSGGIIQTIFGSQFPGKSISLQNKITHAIDLDNNAKSIVYEITAKDKMKPVVLLAHGMGGCSESGYIKRIAGKLGSWGYGVFMINHRGSGPGMGLSSRLWNGGSSDDLSKMVTFILKRYSQLILIGFSLSGNILLKYLGEGRSIPSGVIGALAVNPPIDLRVASHILSTSRSCWLFNQYYMKLIRNQTHALKKNFPNSLDPNVNFSTIWDFDVSYTAPAGGYDNVDAYYDACSGKKFVDKIKIPTDILCSLDDPFVPPDVFRDLSHNINIYQPKGGGHLGYISSKLTPFGDYRWMDYVVLEWIKDMHKNVSSL